MKSRSFIGLCGGLAILLVSHFVSPFASLFAAQPLPPGVNLKAIQVLHFADSYLDPYHALGVLSDASDEEIKSAFRIQMAYVHPDRTSAEYERQARRLAFAKDRLIKHRAAVNSALRAMFQDWPRSQAQRYQQALKDREARVALARERAQVAARLEKEAEAAKRAEEARRAKYAPPPNPGKPPSSTVGSGVDPLASRRAARALKAYGSVRETAIPGCEKAYGRIVDVFDDRIPSPQAPK